MENIIFLCKLIFWYQNIPKFVIFFVTLLVCITDVNEIAYETPSHILVPTHYNSVCYFNDISLVMMCDITI